jgi:hypothetical protein
MRIAHVRVCLPDTYSEIPVEDVEDAEMAIEAIVSTALLEVFDTVLVENVTIQHSPDRDDGRRERRAA